MEDRYEMIILRIKNFTFREDMDDVIQLTPKIKLVKSRIGRLGRILRYIPSIKRDQDAFVNYDIFYSGREKSIGFIQVVDNGSLELNVVHMAVDEDFRGQGIATKIMETIIALGKKLGYKCITLEAADNSPDGIHIYRKLGFKDLGHVVLKDDFLWGGGYTKMRLDI